MQNVDEEAQSCILYTRQLGTKPRGETFQHIILSETSTLNLVNNWDNNLFKFNWKYAKRWESQDVGYVHIYKGYIVLRLIMDRLVKNSYVKSPLDLGKAHLNAIRID